MLDTRLMSPDKPEADAKNPMGVERERMHQQMLSSVSHDLKTPLASIIGSLEVYERMKDRLSEEKQKTLISVALQEAYRLDIFITNILYMSKLENGMVKVRRDFSDIGGILRNCLLRLSSRLKGCEVSVEAVSGVFDTSIDISLLGQAVTLILDNAVKFSGSPPVIKISYGRAAKPGEGYIKIRDNGQGIEEGQIENIFSKYTRFAKQDQQNAGPGLGLAICREIMHLLGGDVSAANIPGGGAEFTLHFISE